LKQTQLNNHSKSVQMQSGINTSTYQSKKQEIYRLLKLNCWMFTSGCTTISTRSITILLR